MNFTYCPQCGKKGTVEKQDDTNYECASCQWHFWNNAKSGIILVFLKPDCTILVAQRGREPRKGTYDLPGGFLDYNEDPYEAAAREAKEETGLTIKDPLLLTAYTSEYGLVGISVCDLVMVVRDWEGTPKAADDVANLEWKPLDFIYDPTFSAPMPGLPEKLRALL